MKRRNFVAATGAVAAATFLGARVVAEEREESMTQETFELSDAEWRERLTMEQYQVLRKEGTERPGSSELNDEKRAGIFVCAGCELPLFSSETKYESGTGWPSFYAPLEGAVQTRRDFKLILPRTEYHCSRCGGHQGHVFKDGPPPTGLRYCNNGVALMFVPETA